MSFFTIHNTILSETLALYLTALPHFGQHCAHDKGHSYTQAGDKEAMEGWSTW